MGWDGYKSRYTRVNNSFNNREQDQIYANVEVGSRQQNRGKHTLRRY